MKKLLFLLCLTMVILPNLVFGEEELNGYTWKKHPEAVKIIFIRGFLDGYRGGFMEGTLIGYQKGKNRFLLTPKNAKDIKEENVEKFIEDTIFVLDLFEPYLKLGLFPEDKTIFYVNEVDSFLEQFPLCKKMPLEGLLSELAKIWTLEGRKKVGDKFVKQTSYKEVAEQCLEAPK